MFNYNSEDARLQAEKLKALLGQNEKYRGDREDKYAWFNMPHGMEKVTIRILPIFVQGGYMMVYRHKKLPGQKKSFLCLKTNGVHCPICEKLRTFQGRMDLRDFEAQEKVYVNGLFVRATDDNNNLVSVFDMDQKPYLAKKNYLVALSGSLFKWVVDSMADREKGDVLHPMSGRNVTFQRERVGGAFKLREWSFQPTPIGDSEEEVNKLYGAMYKIPEIWKAPDDAFYKESKEIAEILGMQLEQNLRALTGGMGSMDQAHPKAFAPTGPAHQLVNPAFPQPPAQSAYQPPVQQQPAYVPPPAQHNPAFGGAPQGPTAPVGVPINPITGAPVSLGERTSPGNPGAVSAGFPTAQPVPQQPATAPAWTPPAPVASAPAQAPQQTFAPPMAAAPSATGLSTAPKGAPGCFSDPTVFNRASSKCMVCNYDFHCEKAIQSARPANP